MTNQKNKQPMNKKLGAMWAFLLAFVVMTFCASPAMAVAVDMSGVVTGVTDQITESWETSIPIIAAILGIVIGVRLIKRWAK